MSGNKHCGILIGLVGVERCGKDTIADYLVDQYGFKKYSLASPIRDIGKIMFGWTDDKLSGPNKDIIDPEYNIKPRDFFKWIGTEICQYEIYNKFPELKESLPPRTIWANMMAKFINDNIASGPIVVTDIRFKHEADIFQNKLGGLLIYVNRDEKESLEQLAKYDLTYLIKYRLDHMFDNNNDLETTYLKINELVEMLWYSNHVNMKTYPKTLEIDMNHMIDTSNTSLFI
jgi:hypothetical protein